jgi:hypothetical protein
LFVYLFEYEKGERRKEKREELKDKISADGLKKLTVGKLKRFSEFRL